MLEIADNVSRTTFARRPPDRAPRDPGRNFHISGNVHIAKTGWPRVFREISIRTYGIATVSARLNHKENPLRRRDAIGNSSHYGIAGRSTNRMAPGVFVQPGGAPNLATARNLQTIAFHRVK